MPRPLFLQFSPNISLAESVPALLHKELQEQMTGISINWERGGDSINNTGINIVNNIRRTIASNYQGVPVDIWIIILTHGAKRTGNFTDRVESDNAVWWTPKMFFDNVMKQIFRYCEEPGKTINSLNVLGSQCYGGYFIQKLNRLDINGNSQYYALGFDEIPFTLNRNGTLSSQLRVQRLINFIKTRVLT